MNEQKQIIKTDSSESINLIRRFIPNEYIVFDIELKVNDEIVIIFACNSLDNAEKLFNNMDNCLWIEQLSD